MTITTISILHEVLSGTKAIMCKRENMPSNRIPLISAHRTNLEVFGGWCWAVWLTHVKADHGGGLGQRVQLWLRLDAVLCGNTHLVVAPVGRCRKWGRRQRGCFVIFLLFLLTIPACARVCVRMGVCFKCTILHMSHSDIVCLFFHKRDTTQP